MIHAMNLNRGHGRFFESQVNDHSRVVLWKHALILWVLCGPEINCQDMRNPLGDGGDEHMTRQYRM